MLRLAPALLEKGSYWEGLSLCEKALKALAKCSRIDNWSGLLYWEGKFEKALLDMDELEEEKVIKTYKRAYYAACLFGESSRAEELKTCLESRGTSCIK